MEPIRVGIVGLGSIGVTHARAIRELAGEAQLVAYSGGSPEKAAEAGWPDAQQVPVEELLAHAEVDVVAICSPSATHASQARTALGHGKHVVVEKPLALSIADAEDVVAAAEARGLTLSVISQRRFEPEHVAVKRLLESGELGRIRLATTQVHWWRDDNYYAAAPWRARMDEGGGSVMNQGVHNIDLLTWLCGPVAEVTAQFGTLAHDIDAEDTTVATVRFDSGALGLISTSTATYPGSPATITLHTDRGLIELGQGEILRWEVDVPRPDLDADARAASGAADPVAIGILGHVAQWRDVVSAIRDGRRPLIPGADGASAVRLMCAMYEAARSGRAVKPEELT